MNNIAIIEFPSNLGLKEPAPGHEPGVKKLPEWLRQHQFHELLQPEKVYRLEPPAYTMQVDKESGVRNADSIVQYAGQQAALLQQVLDDKFFPVSIGGDCSILVGIAAGLKKRGNYALFFLDGHTDFIEPHQSGTAGAAGMDLAIVTGHGHSKLTDIDHLGPYIQEELVYCVGNREIDDPNYLQPILDSKAHYYDLYALRQTGIVQCKNGFLEMVSLQKADGFWIHFDVDVLNNDIMPCVDSPQPGGLSYDEMHQVLQLLMSDPRCTGINITFLDPELDTTGQYTQNFVQECCGLFESIV